MHQKQSNRRPALSIEHLLGSKENSLRSATLKTCFWLMSFPYRVIVSIRNWMFDRELRKINRFDVPIIAVGNITVGGTGKTPMVAYLVKTFLNEGLTPAIVSRGYAADSSGSNDEYKELKLRFPNVEHLQNADRSTAVDELLRQSKPDVIILDDGFQHRKLGRDLDLVLIDCRNPFGFGYVLPRGFLREPMSSLRRADMVVMTRISQVDSHTADSIRQSIQAINSDAPIGEVAFVTTKVVCKENDGSFNEQPIEKIQNKKAIAFCGIGNPAGFAGLLSSLGQSLEPIEFPDHHAYSESDVDEILERARDESCDLVICTMKDFVKVESLWPVGACPLAAVQIETEFRSGKDEMKTRLINVVKEHKTKSNSA